MSIHFRIKELVLPKDVQNSKKESLAAIGSSKKIVFTRNPYTKIFSAYIDKVFLYGLDKLNKKIIKMATGKTCENKIEELSVSFSKALRFGKFLNEHFLAPSELCDMCNVPYDYVGKMETFNDDVKFFLNSLNKSYVYDQMGDVDSNTEKNIVYEIAYRTYGRLGPKINKDCNFCYVLFKRVWDAFKIRGFFSDFIKYPIGSPEQCCQVSRMGLISRALKALSDSEPRDVRRLQRQKYFLMAFRSVPLKYLKSFRNTVTRDCEMFDYDCSPPEIFAGRKDGDEEKNIFSD